MCATASFALQGGPTQPDYVQFEPSGMTDMVSLLSGDFSYQIPLSDIPSPYGNYPLSLSYHAGISPQQEASWVGLGWNLNPGAINRQVRGVPDDQIHGGTLGFIYQYSYARAWSINLGYGNSVFSVGLRASSDGSVGFSLTINGEINDVMSACFKIGSNEIGFNIGRDYGFAGVYMGVDYSDKIRTNVGTRVAAAGGSLSAQVGTGKSTSAHVGFGNSEVGSGLTVSSDGLSISTNIGVSRAYIGKKGSGVFVYAGGGGLAVSNSPNDGSRKTSSFYLPLVVPISDDIFSAGYAQVLNEYWIRAQTLDDVYGYMYQAGPSIDVRKKNNVSGLPDVEAAHVASLLGKGWETDIKGRSLESMGRDDLSPAYDMYFVSSEGVRGSFRPFAREKHQLYKKISNEKTKDSSSVNDYSTILIDDPATGWPSRSEFKEENDNVVPLGDTYKDYAHCLLGRGKCSVYGMYQTNFRNRGNRLVFDSDENQFEERGGIRFLFVGEGNGYYESEDVEGSKVRSRKYVSDSLLKRTVNGFEYALYGSKKIEPLFEDDSPIGKLKGFVITSANGYRYYFTQPVRSHYKIDYSVNREKGAPVFADQANNAYDDWFDNLSTALNTTFSPFIGKIVKSFFGLKSMEEKCKPDENKKKDDYFYSYAANVNSYATQWLLTEIQGADYLKIGDKNIGYNVKLSYTDPSLYLWRSPYARPGLSEYELPNFRAPRNTFTPEGCDARMYQASFGLKEYVYLKSIETATHRVEFELNTEERVDGKGWETKSTSMPPILTQVVLGMEILNKDEIARIDRPPEKSSVTYPDGYEWCIITEKIIHSDCKKIYWHHNVTWKPKYLYLNMNLSQDILNKLYDGKIKILGLDNTNTRVSLIVGSEGIEKFDSLKTSVEYGKKNFVLKNLSNDREFAVVRNSFKKTVGEESKIGMFRLELEAKSDDIQINYLIKDIKDYVNGLKIGDTLIVGIYGNPATSLVENIYVDWSNVWTIDNPDKLGENEMRYLKKISYFNKNDKSAYKEYLFDYDYSLQPKTLNSYCRGRYPQGESAVDDILKSPDSVGVDICKTDVTSKSLYGKLTLRSITEKGCQNGKCMSLPPYKFSYNMQSATSTRISNSGKWIDYFQENLAKPDDDNGTYDVVNLDDDYFTGFTDLDATILASSNMIDEYGLWSNSANPENHKVDQSFADYGASAWSLNKIVDPAGGNLEIEYERDRYGAGIDYSQDKRTIDIDGFDSCHSYSAVESKYNSNLCIVVKPLYWREECLGPRTAYWDSEKPINFQGNDFAYLDSMDVKDGANLFFNLIAQLKTKVRCKSGLGKCTRDRSVSVVGDGMLEKIVSDGNDKKILVVDRPMKELFTTGQKAANKINDNKWRFSNGSRSGYAWTGKKLNQVKAGNLRVTKLVRHDVDLKSVTSYEYGDGEIAQLPDSSFTTVLGNRFYSSKISQVIPDVYLDPISRIVGIDDKDLMYLPGPNISYPKVTVKNSSEDTSTYNGSTEFFYITPETGVPEEFIDSETRDSLKPFVKLNLQYASMDEDDDYDDGVLYDITLLDVNYGILAGTESKRVILFPDDKMSLYFYSTDASSAKYVRVEKVNSNSPEFVEMWSSVSLNESLRTPFTKFNEVAVSIYGKEHSSVKVLWKRSQKEGFFPILYKKCDYEKVAIDLKRSTQEIYQENDGLIDYESNVTYHDLSAFLGQNYKILSKRGRGNKALVLMMDSSVYSTVVPDVLDKNIPDEKKNKIGRQVEKWSSDLQMQCVNSKGENDIAGKNNVCKEQVMNLYIRTSGATIHKEYKYVRYPVFQVEKVNYVGYDNQKLQNPQLHVVIEGSTPYETEDRPVALEPEMFGITKIKNYAYEALTGAPTATLATMNVGDKKTLRKLTNITPYYMADIENNKNNDGVLNMSDEMFLRNMLSQNYMEELYTDTLKNVNDSSWKKIKIKENLRSFSISPYRVAPEKIFDGATGSMPIIAVGTFQSKVDPSGIRDYAMNFVDGSLDYINDTLDYKNSMPSLEEYSGNKIIAFEKNLKVTETKDVLGRSMATISSNDGMFPLSLFFPAKRNEVGVVVPYKSTVHSSKNCTTLDNPTKDGNILISDYDQTLGCTVSVSSGNLVKEYRIWTRSSGWKTEHQIVPVSSSGTVTITLSIPANAKLNYFRVYPERAESKSYIFDKYGNMIQIVAEDNTSTYYEYDPLGNLVQSRNDDGVSFKAHHREYMNDTPIQKVMRE